MIGLDTNLLVRYLVQDDPIQSPKATEVFERRLTAANPGFVSVVVMVETVSVLERAYGLGRAGLAAAIEGLLRSDELAIEHEQEVFTALTALKRGHGSFADALVGALAAKAGCTRILSFDRRALRLPGFEHP